MKPASYPDDAQIVFEGYRFNIYERKRTESDDKDYTYHSIHRKSSVSIFVTQGEYILLPKFTGSYQGDYIGVFGGIIDQRGDDYMRIAKEELLEEAGMESNQRSHWKSFQYHGFEGQVHFVIAKNCKTVTSQSLSGAEGNIEIISVSLDEFLTMAINEEIRGIPDCLVDLCKIYYDPMAREDFRKKLFG